MKLKANLSQIESWLCDVDAEDSSMLTVCADNDEGCYADRLILEHQSVMVRMAGRVSCNARWICENFMIWKYFIAKQILYSVAVCRNTVTDVAEMLR